jgi:putative addiction module component (TIGR02574 family)
MDGRDQILRSVLELPERERAEVARDILESLDQGETEEVAAAWAQEVAQRIQDLTHGNATTMPADEAFDRVRRGFSRS